SVRAAAEALGACPAGGPGCGGTPHDGTMLAALRHLSPCPACGAAPTGPDACCRACLEAMFSPRLAGGVLALGAHRGRLRRALMAYKYRGAARLAGPFGAELARLVASTGWRPEAVTSVPPHPG